MNDATPRRPVQQLLLALVIVFFGVSLVYVLYDRGVLPVAGPFVALLVVPLILFLRAYWWQGKVTRLARQAAGHLTTLSALVDEERARPQSARSSGADESSLAVAAEQVRAALQRLAWGQEGAGAGHVHDLMATARAAWTPGTPLYVAAEQADAPARAITDAVRRIERSAAKSQ